MTGNERAVLTVVADGNLEAKAVTAVVAALSHHGHKDYVPPGSGGSTTGGHPDRFPPHST